MRFDIVTLGSAVIDTFVNTDVGEKDSFMRYPVGSKMLIKELRADIGGGATNTATAFSRFGFKTGCICNVGNDNNGKDILTLLKKEKITFLGAIRKAQTGYSVILDSKKHNRTILTYKGPNNNIRTQDIPDFQTKWLYYSSAMETSYETQRKLAKKLARENVKLAFNPSSYLIKNKDISDLLKITEVLILNKEEAEMLCRKYKKRGDIMKALCSLGPKIAVVTDRDNPTQCYNVEKVYTVKPHKSIKVLERTGAGDAFAAGFIAGLMANYTIDKCLKLATEESESVLGYFGAKNNLIKRKIK